MQSIFTFDYRNTEEYRLYIETLPQYQQYLFNNDQTEYVGDPRVYFKRLYTEKEAEYLTCYCVYHLVLNHIYDNFCVQPFSKYPSDFRFIKGEFDYLERLYGPSCKPDLSGLVRDEDLLNKAQIFWTIKVLMNTGNWEEIKTILESNLNIVDEHFICLYYEHFWYSSIENITPLDIAIRLGFDINNSSKKVTYTGGTLLSWILTSCSDSYKYDIEFTKSEDYILELIQYCFERGAVHPKYITYTYKTLMLYMDDGRIKQMFEYYENQVETQFDFSKYQLLSPKDKTKVKNFLSVKMRVSCMISDMLSLFSVRNFI